MQRSRFHLVFLLVRDGIIFLPLIHLRPDLRQHYPLFRQHCRHFTLGQFTIVSDPFSLMFYAAIPTIKATSIPF